MTSCQGHCHLILKWIKFWSDEIDKCDNLKRNRGKSWIGDLLIRRLTISQGLRLNQNIGSLLFIPATVSSCGGDWWKRLIRKHVRSCVGKSQNDHCITTSNANSGGLCGYLDMGVALTWHGWFRRWKCAPGCNGSHQWRSWHSKAWNLIHS